LKEYDVGEIIYSEGDKPEFFHGIIKGKVSIRKKELKRYKNDLLNIHPFANERFNISSSILNAVFYYLKFF